MVNMEPRLRSARSIPAMSHVSNGHDNDLVLLYLLPIFEINTSMNQSNQVRCAHPFPPFLFYFRLFECPC